MTETKTLNGLIQVKRNYGPSLANVMFSWLFYGMFRMALYRFLFPWSVFGIALNIILLSSAISLTFRALISPRYHYTFHKVETGYEDPSKTYESTPETYASTINEQEFKADTMNPVESLNTQPPVTNVEQEFIKKPDPEIINPPPLRRSESKVDSKEENVQYCSSCGVENTDFARFCCSCGERLR